MCKMRRILGVISIILLLLMIMPFSVHASKVKRIKESGMARDYSFNIFSGGKPVDQKTFFNPSESIYWFCSIKNGSTWGQPKMKAKWYAPNGDLFDVVPFSSPKTHYLYAKAQLPVEGAIDSDLWGNWKVEVYWDEEKVDEQSFFIGEKKYDSQPVVHEVKEVSEELNSSDATQKESEENSKDRKQRIKRSGLATGYNISTKEALHEKYYFSPKDSQVVWWCDLRPLSTWGQPEMRAKWFDPYGNLYKEERFTAAFMSGYSCMKTKMKIKNEINENLYGKWKVDIYWNQEKVDEQHFEIGTNPPFKELPTSKKMKEQSKYKQNSVDKVAYDKENAKDYHYVYVDYFISTNETSEMGPEREEKIKNRFATKLEEIGFTVVDSIDDAGIKVRFIVEDASIDFFTWETPKMYIEFVDIYTGVLLEKVVFYQVFQQNKEGIHEVMDKLLKQLVKNKFFEKNSYAQIPREKIAEVKDVLDEDSVLSKNPIYKNRAALKSFNSDSCKNIGILSFAVWRENPNYPAWKNEKGTADGVYVYKPEKKHTFLDMALQVDPTYSDVSLITEMSHKQSLERGLRRFFRDDFRDVFFFAFREGLKNYKVNLYEIKWEDYKEDLFKYNLEDLLVKMKKENPLLDGVFVTYYIPLNRWYTRDTVYIYYKEGLTMEVFTSYFSFNETKVSRKLKDYFYTREENKIVGKISYNKLYDDVVKNIKKKFRKSNDTLSKLFVQKDGEKAYVKRENAILFDDSKASLLELALGSEVYVISEKETMYKVLLEGFIYAKDIKYEGGYVSFPGNSKITLKKNLSFKNSVGRVVVSKDKNTLARIIKPDNVSLAREPEYVDVGDGWYHIFVEGYVNKEDLVFNKKDIKKKMEQKYNNSNTHVFKVHKTKQLMTFIATLPSLTGNVKSAVIMKIGKPTIKYYDDIWLYEVDGVEVLLYFEYDILVKYNASQSMDK